MTAEEFAEGMQFLLEEYGEEEPDVCLGKMVALMEEALNAIGFDDGVSCYRELLEALMEGAR